jgi:hypothetical protein
MGSVDDKLHVVAAPGSGEKDAAAHLAGDGRGEDGRAPSAARATARKRPSGRVEKNVLGS